MREILFKGKRADNGEWVEGIFLDKNNLGVFYDDTEESDCTVHIFSVIPEAVGQYTGLTDKNGTKIFDGDIVIWRFSPCIVKWDAINACYSLYQNGKTKISGFNADTMKLFEVIGNIHDNPDLIKQEAEK